MGLLRFLLAVSVVIWHSGPVFGISLISGDQAVKCFYVISGFYMELVLSTKYSAKPLLKSFYLNRFLRIYPPYFLVLCITIIIGISGGGGHPTSEIRHLPLASCIAIMVTTLFIYGQDWAYFFKTDAGGYFHFTPYMDYYHSPAYLNYVGQAWTLGLECTFYLFAPYFSRLKLRKLIFLTVGLIAIRYWCMDRFHLQHEPWQYRFFPFELPLFLTGMLLYRCFKQVSEGDKNTKIASMCLWPVIIFLSRCYSLCSLDYNSQTIIIFIPVLFLLTRNFKPDAWIGEFSYPVYISHFLMRDYLPHFFPAIWGSAFWGYGGGLLACSMLFSIPLILLDRYSDRWKKHPKPDAVQDPRLRL